MQTGACMLEILTFLEKYRLGLYAVPAPGDLTIGGVLAIGGHGTGVPYVTVLYNFQLPNLILTIKR